MVKAKRKILIVGSDGQLAFDLIKVLGKSYKIVKANHGDFDVADSNKTEQFLKKQTPDIVINAAAFNKTEECELNPERGFETNAVGAYNISKAAALIGAKIIFISTDYVFDGSKKSFSEDDKPNPLNVYGVSKLAGELLTQIANPDYLIIRTSWLYGTHQSGKGYNFVTLMLEKAKNDECIKVVNDQFGSPTYTGDLALKTKELIDRNIPAGIYHVTNSGSCSWYEFARKIFELTNIKVNLETVDSALKFSNIKRPRYSVLKSNKLNDLDIPHLRTWQDALDDFLNNYK